MKEIGLKLKEKREENGVTLEEAASDLKVKPKEINSIEEGRKEDFVDVLLLKSMIQDYAKYLGLDGEAILDEFNEYLFEQTSKISLSDIEEAIKEKEIREKDLKILSPYTVTKSKKKNMYVVIGVVFVLIFVCIFSLILVNRNNSNDYIDSNISYRIGE